MRLFLCIICLFFSAQTLNIYGKTAKSYHIVKKTSIEELDLEIKNLETSILKLNKNLSKINNNG